MGTDRSSRAGRVLARISETLEELDEAHQRRLEARTELFALRRPESSSARRRAVDESRAGYERRAWDEFTC